MGIFHSAVFLLVLLMLFSCTDCSCVDADMTENMAALLKTLEVVLTTYDATSLPEEGNDE